MCECLVFIADRSTTGDPFVDGIAPMAGDVADIREDGAEWGQCERGNPTFTKQTTITVKREITILLDAKMDAEQIVLPGDLYKIKQEDVLFAASSKPDVLIMDDGIPEGVVDIVANKDDNTVQYVEYRRRVVSEEDRPISEHPLGNHPFWRILRFPGIPAEQLDPLMQSEISNDPQMILLYPRYRQRYIDLSKFVNAEEPGLADFLGDDTRSQMVFDAPNLTAKQLLTDYVSVRPPVEV